MALPVVATYPPSRLVCFLLLLRHADRHELATSISFLAKVSWLE